MHVRYSFSHIWLQLENYLTCAQELNLLYAPSLAITKN